jgi:hypothetical protein
MTSKKTEYMTAMIALVNASWPEKLVIVDLGVSVTL